ncbi:MAG: hypothetical protein ACOYI4_08405, partial [Christensenellales bacterium]|jgi:small-conductance mechanosensitive channel
MGITQTGDSTLTLRLICRVRSMMHFEAERLLREEILSCFAQEGIEHPYPRFITLKGGQAAE